MATVGVLATVVIVQFVVLALLACLYLGGVRVGLAGPAAVRQPSATTAALTYHPSADPYERMYRARAPAVTEPLRGPVAGVSVSTAPALPPFRTYQPSNAARNDFQQVGYAYGGDSSKVLPVYSRPAPRNPSRFQYYTRAEGTDVSMALVTDRGACLGDVGCEELQTGDKVRTDASAGEMSVTIYDTV
jgi:hypothetical protein